MSGLVEHEVCGPGTSPALLLIPPLGGDRRFWDACVAIWRKRYTCVALDPRSLSPGPSRPLPVSLDQHAADIEHLRSSLGFGLTVPIGCAIGSMIAAAYAGRHPGATAALVLANATDRSSPQARAMLQERAATVRREGISAILPGALERAFSQQPRDGRYRDFYERFAAQPAEAYAAAAEASALYDVTGDLSSIRCPTLVCPGEHDLLLPPDLSARVAEAIEGSRLVLVEGAAHFVPYQQPRRFAELVLQFLDAALPATAR